MVCDTSGCHSLGTNLDNFFFVLALLAKKCTQEESVNYSLFMRFLTGFIGFGKNGLIYKKVYLVKKMLLFTKSESYFFN